MADDLNFQNISTVQNDLQQRPRTLASAATIAPTTFLTFVTGATGIDTITPPVTGCHMLALVGGTSVISTNGNVLVGTTLVANRVLLLFYNPITGKYSIMSTANA